MRLVLIPSSAKRIAKHILVIAKLNGTKDIVLRGCAYDMIFPRKQLSIQNLQLKHKNKV